MEKLYYDDLLGEYLDENGVRVAKIPVVESHSYGQVFETDKFINNDVELEKQKEQAISIEKSISNFKEQIKALEETKKRVNERLLEEMQKRDMWKIELNNGTIITRVKASEKHTIDTKRLKAEMPDIAKMYEQITNVDECIRIKIGGTENGNN